MSKLKKARNKKYTPLSIKTRSIKESSKRPKLTVRNILNDELIKRYINYLATKKESENKIEKELFEEWETFSYKTNSNHEEFAKKFLDWFNHQKKNFKKVYGYNPQKNELFKIKKAVEVNIENKDIKTLLVEVSLRENGKSQPATLTFTRLKGLESKDSLVIYNSDNKPFLEEIEPIERIITKTEKIIVKQEINSDKKNEEKIKKLTTFLKTKTFEKSYLNSLESIKEEILKIIN